jgi:hypothetical protein
LRKQVFVPLLLGIYNILRTEIFTYDLIDHGRTGIESIEVSVQSPMGIYKA